jgi:hypothetical protein
LRKPQAVDDIEKNTVKSCDLFPFPTGLWLNARLASVIDAQSARSHGAAAKGGGPRR